MKRFWGFVRKEFYHIIRDSKTILVLFGMPVAQMFIFGFALSNEIKDVKIAILDQSKDVVTRQIQSHLFSSGFFVLDASLNSEAEIGPAFRKGIIKEVIIFEPGFAENPKRDGGSAARSVHPQPAE